MSQRLPLLIAIAVAVIAILFTIEAFYTGAEQTSELRFSPGVIRGSAIEKNGKQYTLNSQQQSLLLSYLNRAQTVGLSDDPTKQELPTFQKIILYRINKSDVVVTPLFFLENNFVFRLSEPNDKQEYMTLSDGDLKTMLNSATDSKNAP